MKQTENSKLVLHLPDATVQTNVMKIQLTSPMSLTFTRLLRIEDYPFLENSQSSEHLRHLIGLLFSHDPLFTALEQRLEMIELQDGTALDDVYIIAHKRSRIGSVIDNSTIGLFKYSQRDLYCQSVPPVLKHLSDLKALKAQLLRDLFHSRGVLNEHEQKFNYYTKLYEEKVADNKSLKHEFELSKNAVSQLSFQLNNLNDQLRHVSDIFCLFCHSEYKNVLFLPCSHIVGCRECILPSPDLVCSLCKQRVEEYREIQFEE